MYDMRSIASATHAAKQDEVGRFLVFALTGFAVLFGIVMLFRSNDAPLESLVVATTAGFAALAVSGFWLLRYRQGGTVYILLLTSYLARVLFGIYVYTALDPGYFQGAGAYLWGHPEIESSFEAARIVSEALTSNTDFSWAWAMSVLNEGDTKNPLIHWWMGLFLAAGKSTNAMDLAPFNAVHMSIAALGIIAFGLASGYSRRAALLAGILTAWYPFAFISSLLWRDAVGFLFVILSVMLASKFRPRNLSTWPHLVAAIFLSFANRTIYPIVILMSYFASASAPTQGVLRGSRSGRRKATWAVGLVVTLVAARLFSDYLFLYHTKFSASAVFERMLYLPILLVRAILGPFPWFNEHSPMEFWTRILEFAFHTLQLAVFLVIAQNYRRFFHAPDLHVYAFLLFFGTSMLAPGIHTAYLAVGLPFIFARVFSLVRSFPLYVISALCLFLIFNVLFYQAGLSGQGLSQEFTGY